LVGGLLSLSAKKRIDGIDKPCKLDAAKDR
jgi:hypothetical protein